MSVHEVVRIPPNRADPNVDNARQAMCEWLKFHGVDPNTVPWPAVITRVGDQRRFIYEQFVYDGPKVTRNLRVVDGDSVTTTRVEQGEGIAPLPPEVMPYVEREDRP